MSARLAADAVLVVHLAFVAFVVAGGFAALRWPRIAWIHLPAACWGVLVEWLAWPCPLTPLEIALRRSAGEAGYGGGFVVAADAFLKAADGPLDDFDDLCETEMFSKHVWDSVEDCKNGVRLGRLNPEGSLQFGATQYAKNREHVTEVMDALDLDVLIFPVDAYGAPNVTASKANCIETSVTGMPAMTLIGKQRTPEKPPARLVSALCIHQINLDS